MSTSLGRRADHIVSDILDPMSFIKTVLGHRTWWMQEQIVKAVTSKPKSRTVVKACHASSKTFTFAELAWYWLARFRDGKVITTAPVFRQTQKLIWTEIRKARMMSDLAQQMFPMPLQTEINMGPDNYALGMSTDEAVNFQGWHGNVLLIIDEAPGVTGEIFDAIEGVRAGGDVRVIMGGNPTIAAGPFYDAFTTNRKNWNTFSISAFDCPNLRRFFPEDYDFLGTSDGELVEVIKQFPDEALEDNPWPMLVTPDWVIEKWDDWGPGHPNWDARVMGRFPSQSPDALIPLAYVERAMGSVTDVGAPCIAGIDVAGPGESETTLWIRSGSRLLYFEPWESEDPRGSVAACLHQFKDRLDAVHVDVIGTGWYFARYLEDLGYPVVDVDITKPPAGYTEADIEQAKERFANLKSQSYWLMREAFFAGEVHGLNDELSVVQLTTLKYKHDARGRVVIESKQKMMDKYKVPSPDRAEGLMLTFVHPAHRSRGNDYGVTI